MSDTPRDPVDPPGMAAPAPGGHRIPGLMLGKIEHRERIEDQGVEEVMVRIGDSYIQLLGATGPDTTVGKFLERRGEGLHHIAYEVDDLEASLAQLREQGVQLIDEKPRRGGRGHMVAFVHPKGNRGLLVELIQQPDH